MVPGDFLYHLLIHQLLTHRPSVCGNALIKEQPVFRLGHRRTLYCSGMRNDGLQIELP